MKQFASKAAVRRFSMPILLLMATLGGTMGVASAATAPDAMVKSTTEEVLAAIRQNPDPNKLAKVGESKVLPHFDFNRMTRLAVGKSWAQASAQQQQTLEKEFRNLLVRTYTTALASSSAANVTVEVKPLRNDADGKEVTVKTQVTQPGHAALPIDYRMGKVGDDWKVYDVSVENVSLVTNYRNSFAQEINQSGIDGLIKSIADKNRKRETS